MSPSWESVDGFPQEDMITESFARPSCQQRSDSEDDSEGIISTFGRKRSITYYAVAYTNVVLEQQLLLMSYSEV